jgi:DNA-directed RNA polymerase specialized sigma24 family protein
MLPSPEDVRPGLEALLADRHSEEARALFLRLARYIDGRVTRIACSRYGDVLSAPDREEITGEVLLELMNGALVNFRGHALGELLAFVRCITDRCCWRAARRRLRERDALNGEIGEEVATWTATMPAPDALIQFVPDCPLDPEDEDYLLQLLAAGSRAELARHAGVSRAAVTQRVQRIKNRIGKLTTRQQSAAEAWMRHKALEAEASRLC